MMMVKSTKNITPGPTYFPTAVRDDDDEDEAEVTEAREAEKPN